MSGITRRQALTGLPLALFPLAVSSGRPAGTARGNQENSEALYPEFPSQRPERVRQMVGASHGNIEVVRKLLRESPALAKATVDWGFGDWETAIGASSHVGNRDITSMLIEHGARPDLFTFAMLGQLDVVKSYVESSPGIQRLKGPHGLTLMHHARKGGKDAEEVVSYLQAIGDADNPATSLPLSEDVKKTFVGTFKMTERPGEEFEVSISRMGPLAIKRNSYGSARNLHYLGNDEFAPVGAEAVRIRFSPLNGAGRTVTIEDGPEVIVAMRG